MSTPFTQADVDRQNAKVLAGKDKLSLLHADVLARKDHLTYPGEGRESVLHEQVQSECKRRGWLACHGRMDKASGRTIGEPDFYVFADEGRWWAIELKVGNAKLRPEQLAFKCYFDARGFKGRYQVVRSLAEFLALVS